MEGPYFLGRVIFLGTHRVLGRSSRFAEVIAKRRRAAESEATRVARRRAVRCSGADTLRKGIILTYSKEATKCQQDSLALHSPRLSWLRCWSGRSRCPAQLSPRAHATAGRQPRRRPNACPGFRSRATRSAPSTSAGSIRIAVNTI